MSIYHWKLGDVALARLCKKVYAKVHVVKDEKGLFYDDKGITTQEDGELGITKELCYYVEINRSKEKLWLPYTSLHLAERRRPFYGPNTKVSPPIKPKASVEGKPSVPKKRRLQHDHIVPMDVKIPRTSNPDLNVTYDIRHMPLKQGKFENAFSEFVRRGKEMLFDHFYILLQMDPTTDEDTMHYLTNVDASSEDKLELVLKNYVTEKEIENYLHQCWKFNFISKQCSFKDNQEYSNGNKYSSPEKLPITLHAPWCLVCGKKEDRLRNCPNCPAAFHLACRKEWLVTIIHRKKAPKKEGPNRVTLIKKILSSTRVISKVKKEKENLELCPSCMWGPSIGYDDVVWHKLGTCPWWPARVLTPGCVPSCLLSRTHSPHEWPLRYYGTNNYSWGISSRMCLFLPSHTAAKDPEVKEAVLDACDDYIAVYLT